MRALKKIYLAQTKRVGTRTLITLPRIKHLFPERVIDNVLHPPFDIEVPRITYTDLIWDGMDVKGHLPAVTCGITGRTLSHGELKEESLKLSTTLQDLVEVRTIGVLLPNCMEYPLITSAAMHAGVTLTTLNPAYTPTEIAHQLRAARVDILITEGSQQEKVNASLALYPGVQRVVYVDVVGSQAPTLDDKSVPFNSMLSSPPAKRGARVDTMKDTAVLPFSSGTTGPPKGVELTQNSLIFQTLSTASDGDMFYRAFGNFQDVTISILPMFHIYGLGITMTGCLWSGARQVILPRFEPNSYIDCLSAYRPTFLHIVPPLVGFLANNPRVELRHLSSLRQITCGAAPCGESLISQFAQKAPNIIFREGWGMTELAGAGTSFYGSYQAYTPGSVNQIIPNTRMRVVDPNTAQVLPVGETGEIQVQGVGVMKGYFNNPEANSNTFTEDGWMKTGDVGHFNTQGIVYVTDRMKELIKVKGFQVAPAELENTLRELEGVEDVAVIGVDDPRAGQLPRAFIVRRGDLTEQRVHSWMSEKLSAHKHLAGGVVFTDSIPKSAAGKILRRELVGK